jgi:hypothetical protein
VLKKLYARRKTRRYVRSSDSSCRTCIKNRWPICTMNRFLVVGPLHFSTQRSSCMDFDGMRGDNAHPSCPQLPSSCHPRSCATSPLRAQLVCVADLADGLSAKDMRIARYLGPTPALIAVDNARTVCEGLAACACGRD